MGLKERRSEERGNLVGLETGNRSDIQLDTIDSSYLRTGHSSYLGTREDDSNGEKNTGRANITSSVHPPTKGGPHKGERVLGVPGFGSSRGEKKHNSIRYESRGESSGHSAKYRPGVLTRPELP